MNGLNVAAAALALLAAAPTGALANAPGQPLADIARADPGEGVTAFTADYFAAARPNTAYDMIGRLPGFTFDGGAQVRGFAGAAGNVLIDGERPTSKQDDLKSALTRVSAAQVARIDLIRGGAPGIDMQGRTVMANVILKHNGGSQGVAQLQNKLSLDSGRYMPGVLLQFSKRSGEHTFEAALNTIGYLDDGAGPGPHYAKDGTGAYIYDSHLWTQAGGNQGNFTAAYSGPLAGGKFRLNGLVFLDDYVDHEADRASLPATNGDDSYKDANANFKSELGAHYTRDFGANTTLEALAIQQLGRQHEHARYLAFGDDEIFDIVNTSAESIARSTLRYRPLPSLTIEGAMEGAYNTQSTATAYSINTVPQLLPAADEMVAETRGEAALSATWSPSPKYTLEAGVRYEASQVIATGDVNEGKSLFYLKPRAVFTWSPDPKDQVRLRVEREVGQLDFSAFTASGSLNAGGLHAGNPNALPQQAWVVEGAFERHFWDKGDATLTLRREEITDAVDRIAFFDPVARTYFDEGGNLPRGVENDLIFDVTVPLDRVIKNGLFKTTATWRDARVTDPITQTERPQTQVHPLEIAAHFTQDLPSIRSTWGLDYVNGWVESYYRFDEIDVYRYGARINAFIEYKPTANLTLRADANDLFSRGFERTIILYPGPRSSSPTPLYTDQRDQQIGPLFLLTVRRSFG